MAGRGTASMGRGIEAQRVMAGVGDGDIKMPSRREMIQFYLSYLVVEGKLPLTSASAVGAQTSHTHGIQREAFLL
jgi:hypothetical protein